MITIAEMLKKTGHSVTGIFATDVSTPKKKKDGTAYVLRNVTLLTESGNVVIQVAPEYVLPKPDVDGLTTVFGYKIGSKSWNGKNYDNHPVTFFFNDN